MSGCITLLTDFGTADGYVAAMKGVIAAIAPAVRVDDASHDIAPGDIEAAAWALDRYWRLYPAGTVHVAVVDPGVGSARRALAAEADGRLFVAPDNGVLTRVLEAASSPAVEIRNPAFLREPVSATFHGRDVFAPAAARLAGAGARAGAGAPELPAGANDGALLRSLGPAVPDPLLLALPQPARRAGAVSGAVVHVDRFGNLITNVPEAWVRGAVEVRVAGKAVGPVRRTYADVAPGEPLALIGSAELLEISVRDRSAAALLGAARGDAVEVEVPLVEPTA